VANPTNTKPALTFDQRRRQIRRELFNQRQDDRDSSEARLFADAQQMDAQLVAEGYKLQYVTTWNQKRGASAIASMGKTHLQERVADLFVNGAS